MFSLLGFLLFICVAACFACVVYSHYHAKQAGIAADAAHGVLDVVSDIHDDVTQIADDLTAKTATPPAAAP